MSEAEQSPELSPEDQLRAEVAGLAVDEILSLCYQLQARPERLRLYLDVLRKRGGERAQFASCLICFDLARQGDSSAQLEFTYLADTIRTLAYDTVMVETLVGGDAYLSFIWELCSAQLEELDSRFDADHTANQPEAGEDVAAIDLLSDADFDTSDFQISVEEPALVHAFSQAVERFLGSIPGVPAYDPEAGFRLRHRRDSDRVERFLRDLESLRVPVAAARGFRALALLFYGTHLRSRSLFGAANERKQNILRDGLKELIESGEQIWNIAGVLSPLHADPAVWSKIAEVLVDFAHWTLLQEKDAIDVVGAYDAVGRIIDRDANRGKWRANRRRGSR